MDARFCKPKASPRVMEQPERHQAGLPDRGGQKQEPGAGDGEWGPRVHIQDPRVLEPFSFLPLCNRNHSAAQERLITVPALLIIARSHS